MKSTTTNKTNEEIIENLKKDYAKSGKPITHEQAVKLHDDMETLADILFDKWLEKLKKNKEKTSNDGGSSN